MAKTPAKRVAKAKPDPQSGMDPTPANDTKAALDAKFAEADRKGDANEADIAEATLSRSIRGW